MKDLRFAFRVLGKNPGLTSIVVLSIALAIAGAGCAFTWLKAVWLNPLPGAVESRRLLTMSVATHGGSGYSTHYRDYGYFRKRVTVFSGLAAYELMPVSVKAEGETQVTAAGVVSDNYFNVLGVRPILGRAFRPTENAAPEANPVAVIGYKLWEDRFSSSPRALGSSIEINGKPFTVIGVAPEGFFGAYGGLAEDLWVPMMMSKSVGLAPDPETAGVEVIGRLKPGITATQAQAEIHVLARSLVAAQPENHRNWDEVLYPLEKFQRGIVSSLFPVMQIVMAIAILVLLIASANVANLLLARASARVREMGIRLALGASRIRLLRQLLTESLLIACMGGTLGWIFVWLAAGSLRHFLPSIGGLTIVLDLGVDWRVFLFCFAVTLFAAVLCGFAPAFASSHWDVADALRDSSRSVAGDRRSGFVRNSLVVGQVALSLVALAGAALFAQSIRSTLAVRTGFDPHHVLLTSYDTLLEGYSENRGQQFYTDLIQKLEGNPAVASVSATSFVPMRMDGGDNSVKVSIPGYIPAPDEQMDIVADEIAPNYLKTMRIGLLAGREFNWQDRADTPGVVVVNEAMAKRYWKSVSDALGRPIQIDKKLHVVAGVASNIVYRRPQAPPSPAMYLPFLQTPANAMTLVVRAAGDPYSALPFVRSAVRSIDPNMPVSRVETLRASMRAGTRRSNPGTDALVFLWKHRAGADGGGRIWRPIVFRDAPNTRDWGPARAGSTEGPRAAHRLRQRLASGPHRDRHRDCSGYGSDTRGRGGHVRRAGRTADDLHRVGVVPSDRDRDRMLRAGTPRNQRESRRSLAARVTSGGQGYTAKSSRSASSRPQAGTGPPPNAQIRQPCPDWFLSWRLKRISGYWYRAPPASGAISPSFWRGVACGPRGRLRQQRVATPPGWCWYCGL